MRAKKKTKKKAAAKAAVAKTKGAMTEAPASAKAKKPAGDQKLKRISALDAAAQVLKRAGKPMRARELITAMAEQGLWKSPGGATPWATLYAAMMREEHDKGGESRFRKVDRGLFQFNG